MTTPHDIHAGHGGSYIVGEDGVRQLVERTRPRDLATVGQEGQGPESESQSESQGE